MIAVISHTERQFRNWLTGWVDTNDHNKFKHVKSIKDVRDERFTEVIRVGPYWHLDNYEEIYNAALTRVSHD
jgi:hypothetical protein